MLIARGSRGVASLTVQFLANVTRIATKFRDHQLKISEKSRTLPSFMPAVCVNSGAKNIGNNLQSIVAHTVFVSGGRKEVVCCIQLHSS